MKTEVIKKIIKKIDRNLGTNFFSLAKNIKKFWNNSNFLNIFRRKIGKIKLKYKISFARGKEIKLHLGCGRIKKQGYINIDAVKTSGADLVCDITKLPVKDNSVDRIENYHVLEHLPVCLMANIDFRYGEKYKNIIEILKEWRRILKPGGKLIIEVPDFDKLVQEYVRADNNRKEEILTYIYGGFRNKNIYDIHRWGVNKFRLTYILQQAGFKKFEFKKAEDYHTKFYPCLRVEAVK